MTTEPGRRSSAKYGEDRWVLLTVLALAGAWALGFSACGAGPVDPAEDPRPKDDPQVVTAYPPEKHGEHSPELDAPPGSSTASQSTPPERGQGSSGGPKP